VRGVTVGIETKTTWSDKLYEVARPKKIMKPVHENNDDSEDETDSQTEDDRSFEETTDTEASIDDDIAVADPRNKQPRGDSNVRPMTIAFSGMPMPEYTIADDIKHYIENMINHQKANLALK
jgi:hypothetical protein